MAGIQWIFEVCICAMFRLLIGAITYTYQVSYISSDAFSSFMNFTELPFNCHIQKQ